MYMIPESGWYGTCSAMESRQQAEKQADARRKDNLKLHVASKGPNQSVKHDRRPLNNAINLSLPHPNSGV